MKKFVKIVSRIWLCIGLAGLVSLVLVSPWYVADLGDEIAVLVYCLVVTPIFAGAAVTGAKPFLSWLRS
jgi:hypothetical protein